LRCGKKKLAQRRRGAEEERKRREAHWEPQAMLFPLFVPLRLFARYRFSCRLRDMAPYDEHCAKAAPSFYLLSTAAHDEGIDHGDET